MVITIRHFYYLWLVVNVVALVASGWFSRITIKKGASWSELIGYQSKFFPIQTLDIAYYDITEFLIFYAIIPYYVYRLFTTEYMWGKKY